MKKWILYGLLFIATNSVCAVELLSNGNFETGDFTGWTTTGFGTTGTCPNDNRDWNVASVESTGCSTVGLPIEGTFAAYNMFDAGDPSTPITYELWQSVVLPANITQANISWAESINTSIGPGVTRVFSVDILDSTKTNILGTVLSTNYDSTNNGATGWANIAQDISSIITPLSGQTINLQFSVLISDDWTGPAGLALDDVSLDVTAVAVPTAVPSLSQFGLLLLILSLLTFMYHQKRT